MAKSAILAIKIVADSKDGVKGIGQAESSLDKLQRKVDKAAVPAGLIAAGAAAAGKSWIDYASSAEQAVGGVETVFGKYAAGVLAQSAKADQALGLSEAKYNDLATGVGGALSKAGFAQDELGAKTDDLITRAADLSSVFGGDTVGATEAMGAALRGEFDSLERYGVFLNASAVNAELAKNGQDKLTGAALDAAKKQTTYNLVMEQSATYAGNYAKEADTAAGAESRATAARENAAASMGEVLLPAYTSLMELIPGVSGFVDDNATAFVALAAIVAGAAGAVLAVSAAIRVYNAVTAIWTGITKAATLVQKGFNLAMRANPIGLVITAITILIGLLVLAYNKSETFRNIVQAAGRVGKAAFDTVVRAVQAAGRWVGSVASSIRSRWDSTMNGAKRATALFQSKVSSVVAVIRRVITGAVNVVRSIGSAFTAAGNVAKGALNGVISVVRSLVGWIGDALGKLGPLKSAGSWLSKGWNAVFGWQRATPASALPTDGSPFYLTSADVARLIPAMPIAPARSAPVMERSLVVNVYGAIDPNRTARQIRSILTNDTRRDGGSLAWN